MNVQSELFAINVTMGASVFMIVVFFVFAWEECVKCWMLTGDFLVLPFAPGGFSLCTTVFPSPQKPTFPNSNSTRNQVEEEPLRGYATCTSKSLFNNIYLFIYKLAQGKHSLLICYWHYILTTGLLFTFKSCLKGTTCNNLCILIW